MDIQVIEHPDKKFVESFFYGDNNEEWEVETDNGWVEIKAVGKTVPYRIYQLETTGHDLLCADNHIVYREISDRLSFLGFEFEEIFVADLRPGDSVLTENGLEKVVSVIETFSEENMYDLQLNNEEKRYFTNGILSHNSMWLCNLSCAGVRHGYNVAYVTLEMAEEKVIKRLACNLLNIPSKEYNIVSEDQSYIKNRFSTISTNPLSVPGILRVKEFPTSSASVIDIENWLRRMEERKKTKFKLVVIDYIGIMRNYRNPNTENSYMKIKQISEDLRAMAMRNNWCVVTASQFNRCLALDTEVISKNGEKLIRDVKIGEELLTQNGWKKVLDVTSVQKRRKVIIRTESGKILECSENHVFPTSSGEFQAKDLTEEMSLFKVSGRYVAKAKKDAKKNI